MHAIFQIVYNVFVYGFVRIFSRSALR